MTPPPRSGVLAFVIDAYHLGMRRIEPYPLSPRSVRGGFTLIEALIALAIIGVLASIGFSSFREPGARLFANDVRALVQQARFEAIKQNVPVAVVWSVDTSEFRTVLGTVAAPCNEDTVLNRADSARYRNVSVNVEIEDGLVWLPSGQARSCSYGPFGEAIATVSDGNGSRQITVTLTGRVTIQ